MSSAHFDGNESKGPTRDTGAVAAETEKFRVRRGERGWAKVKKNRD